MSGDHGARRALYVAAAVALAATACGRRDTTGPVRHVVQLTLSAATLVVGDSARWIVSLDGVWPSPATVTSSNLTVVRVGTDGWIHAVGAGSAAVTASPRRAPSHYAMASVVVTAPPSACALSLGPGLLALNVGDTVDLRSVRMSGCNAGSTSPPLTWRSADSTIVAVSVDGVATGRRPGVTSLVAASLDWPNLQAAMQVTVRPPTCAASCPPLTAGQVVQLEVPGVAGDSARAATLLFTSSDPAVATVSATGLVRALASGAAIVRITRRADGAPVRELAITVMEPRTGPPLSIQSIVRAIDGRPVQPDSAAGEIVVAVNVARRAAPPRSLRVVLVAARGDSLVSTPATPAVTDTSITFGVVCVGIDTAAVDASGQPLLQDGAHESSVRLHEGTQSTRAAAVQVRLTLGNRP